MNSPFGNIQPRADFRPRPVLATDDATETEKLRVTRTPERDFRPKAVVPGPKGSVTVTAPVEEPVTPAKIDPAHPAATSDELKGTGENTQPVDQPPTPKSSSPNPPVIPSKPSASA